MRKLLTLSLLLCALGMALPLGSHASLESECIVCPAGSCNDSSQCPDSYCRKRTGYCCGVCV
jgi:hypothetical protein